MGIPPVGVSIRIAPGDIENIGEIQMRSALTMKGYYEDSSEDSFTEDGWLRTGDLGSIDLDGYLIFEGRLKDMIKPGGENVSTQEVEEFLMLCPGISNVAVFGMPDARLGEVPCAVVQRKTGAELDEESVRKFCKERIATFKIPKRVHFIDIMPLLPNGKMDKVTLSKIFL